MIQVNWEGSLFVHHSLGMVNRELLLELVKLQGLDIRNIPFEVPQFKISEEPRLQNLSTVLKTPHERADIHIRHRWPPELSRPSCKRHVMFQPWEYGSVPTDWAQAIGTTVDEIWVYTQYLKECYIQSGIDANLIHIIPLGVDPDIFSIDKPGLPWLKEKINGRFCFLYNGGVTTRKGADILVNAYLSEFTKDEHVCLVIKDANGYGKDLSKKIKALSLRNDIAPMIYLTDNLSPGDLPGLYRACDCYVQPYRAEGYGLPIAEAMACGLPTIVTGGGACLDFTNESYSYFVNATIETFAQSQLFGISTVKNPFWLVPEIDSVRQNMRYVFNNREASRQMGNAASRHISSNHTWKQGAEALFNRICAINSL